MEYNIPFSMRDVIPSLYGHWIAKDLMAYLELGHGSRARSDFFRIMNRPNRYFSRDAFETPLVSLDQVRDFYRDRDWMQERVMDLEGDLRTIGRLRPGPAIHYIRQAVGYDTYLKEFAAFRRIRPEEFFDIASQIEESAAGFSTLEQWKEHIRQYEETLKEKRREAKDPGRPEGVTLSTMHSSKGLEYRIVFVVDANEGIVPHHKAGLPADIEEERRLFYVAMTRAKERLHLCAVKERYHRKQRSPVREGMHGLRAVWTGQCMEGEGTADGMVHIYCGDGKGKTSAAVGMAVRAAGRGLKVVMVRFLKSDDSGEVAVLGHIPGITVIPCERIFGFVSAMDRETREQAAGGIWNSFSGPWSWRRGRTF